MSLNDLAGRDYGPNRFEVSASAVAAFVSATGDDPGRWRDHAPPSFAAAALFAVAPAFLADPLLSDGIRSLLHSEQEFRWHRRLAVGEALEVTGTVSSVRARGALNLVVFDVAASGDAGPWVEGRSVFLLSSEKAGDAPDEAEPDMDQRGAFDPPTLRPLPTAGDALAPLQRSASRADLIRYGSASGDLNPIHRNHAAARAAGLPGVIVHGLLLASWICQEAGRHAPGPHPLRSLRARFRRPLRPGAPAKVEGRVLAVVEDGADLEVTVRCSENRLVSALVQVTR